MPQASIKLPIQRQAQHQPQIPPHPPVQSQMQQSHKDTIWAIAGMVQEENIRLKAENEILRRLVDAWTKKFEEVLESQIKGQEQSQQQNQSQPQLNEVAQPKKEDETKIVKLNVPVQPQPQPPTNQNQPEAKEEKNQQEIKREKAREAVRKHREKKRQQNQQT